MKSARQICLPLIALLVAFAHPRTTQPAEPVELGKYFAKKEYKPEPLPRFEDLRGQLPSPIYDDNPLWVKTYWRAWELAFQHFHQPGPGTGFVSNFIDAAFNQNIFLWDSCFMTMFCNYADPLVPGISTLDNFYAKQYPDGEISREITRATGVVFKPWINAEDKPLFSRWGWWGWPDPFNSLEIDRNPPVIYKGNEVPTPNPALTLDTLNHPILAWAELEHYRITGDRERLQEVWQPLVHYYEALQKYLVQGNGLYMTDWGSMDNSPRNHYLKDGGCGADISAEMVMFARQLAQIGDILDKTTEAKKYSQDADKLAQLVNRDMWDKKRKFYFDLQLDGQRAPIITIAGFWTLLGKVASPEQAADLVGQLENPARFGRLNLVPNVAADQPGYAPEGSYWRGAVWVSTNTMVIRGLEAYGYNDLARKIALNHVDLVARIFAKTGTIWENYSPDAPQQGNPAKPNFVGWSGLGPIGYFLEYAIGLRPDAPHNELVWQLEPGGRRECERYRFAGHVVTLIASPEAGNSGRVRIAVDSDGPFRLRVVFKGVEKTFDVAAGSQTFQVSAAPGGTHAALTKASSLSFLQFTRGREKPAPRTVNLPSSKVLILPSFADAQQTNSFPTAVALSPDGRYLAILNNGYGTETSNYQQSIAILDLATHRLTDFPEARLAQNARQTYYLGLTFSHDGSRLYASIASLTDPLGKVPNNTGNGIAVYTFRAGQLTPKRFIKVPLVPLAPGKDSLADPKTVPHGMAISYPAGLAVLPGEKEKLLLAENLADDAVVLDAEAGEVLQRFALSASPVVPAGFPYGVVATRDGKTAFCSLWNASAVVQLDLRTGQVVRRIPLLAPPSPVDPSSHPTAMLLSPDEKHLYVTLTNRDRVAVVDVDKGELTGLLSTQLPEQKYGGSDPDALAQTADGKLLFVADASANAVAVFDMSKAEAHPPGVAVPQTPSGFIPTEWYPTALAVKGDALAVITGKGQGTGPNAGPLARGKPYGKEEYAAITTLLHGSVAVVSIRDAQSRLAELTHEVEISNLMLARPRQKISFQQGANPIRHVIYIIKENRTYDQIFGDLQPGNADPSLCMYGEDITPNEHRLARQFGIIDNFYCSGEVSGDGHVWSMAAITSDYNEKTWQVGYRGQQRAYDFEGSVLNHNPFAEDIPNIDDPGTGYIWTDVARHGLTFRDYGEFVLTHWCDRGTSGASPKLGTPLASQGACGEGRIRPGQPLPPNVGTPHGSPNPWPWPIPLMARDEATNPELQDHLDPNCPAFRIDYPDQLRVDEFLNEFGGFVKARETRRGEILPQFVILRLPDDHTAGTSPWMPTPSASIADNDLAVGRVVDAVSHSSYWEDTAIFILEDDAQDGPDHVDAHRSTALVISKYSPGSASHPYVAHDFYTTVSVVRTMEELLGLPPMNNNDAQAPVMTPLFSGAGNQPPFAADYRNRDNKLLYQMNSSQASGAKESERMDFIHADQANTAVLNRILWQDRMGNSPEPAPRHIVFR